MELTGAEILIEGLKSVGVKDIFGVSGSSLLRTMDVLYRTPEIRYVQSQHEGAAMYMANGYSRQSRGLGICLVSPGPAETNCLSGVAQAFYTSTPAVLIAAVESSDNLGLGAAVHHDLDSPRIFAPVTKMAARVERKDRLQEFLQRTLVTALGGRKGPCFLAIPTDFLREKAAVDQPGLRLCRPQPPRGNLHDIEAVAILLEEAKRPLLLAGGGINWSGAHQELLQLAELLGVPVAATKGHSGVFPEDHPLSLGTIQPAASWPAMQTYYEADLIVGIGCAFGYLAGSGFCSPVPKTARVVHIDIDATGIGNVIPVEAAVVGDARMVLQDLLEVLKDRGRAGGWPESQSEWSREVARRKADWAAHMAPLQNSSKVPIRTPRLLSDLRKALPRNAIVAAESGGTGSWFDHAFQGLAPNSIGGWHPLGAEFCEAMGVKVASPEVPVVCLIGDGSMMMSLQEWATAAANNIPVICAVTHNGVFGNMRQTQIERFGSRFIGTDLPIPNFTNIAREFGAYAERVEDPADIIPAVGRALESRRLAVLEFMVDPSAENLHPPKYQPR
ncbi:MAG: thiamine pyrophosphate-binding protein [Chloroflexi bacterium]|nr:thiamine pyrophosphate-binding protein [Chloroflexota bacterium]